MLDDWLGSVLHAQPVRPGMEVKFEPGLPGLKVKIDTDRLQRAFLKVYENAGQALTERQHGRGDVFQPFIRVVTRHGSAGEIEVEIADNGAGMSEEVRARIFEPLFSTRGFGVGLGMSLARQIMEQHGGGIRVASQPGQGSQVTLYFLSGSQ
jgi:signal transduction histidine kinase